MQRTVLLIDDEPHVLEGLKRALRKEGYRLVTAASATEAGFVVETDRVDLIVTDEQMPGITGTEFLARLQEKMPSIIGIVLTGQPTLQSALTAINRGNVYQYFTKPCNEVELAMAIRRAMEQKELLEKSQKLLDLAKRQSALIEEARILRRMQSMSHRERSAVVTRESPPKTTRELLEQIEDELERSKDMLSQDDPSIF